MRVFSEPFFKVHKHALKGVKTSRKGAVLDINFDIKNQSLILDFDVENGLRYNYAQTRI